MPSLLLRVSDGVLYSIHLRPAKHKFFDPSSASEIRAPGLYNLPAS